MAFKAILNLQGLFRLVPHVDGDRLLAVAPWTFDDLGGKTKHRLVVQWNARHALPGVPGDQVPATTPTMPITWGVARSRLRFKYGGAPTDFSLGGAEAVINLRASGSSSGDGLLAPDIFDNLAAIRDDVIAGPGSFEATVGNDEKTVEGVLAQVLVSDGLAVTTQAPIEASFDPALPGNYSGRFVNSVNFDLGDRVEWIEMITDDLVTGEETARVRLEPPASVTQFEITAKHVCPQFFLGAPDSPEVEESRDYDFLWLYELSKDFAALRQHLLESVGALPIPTRSGQPHKTGQTECGSAREPARDF